MPRACPLGRGAFILGYRGELRDLFEAHFGRFEEKLERRLAETAGQVARLEEKFERRLAETRAELVKWMFFFWTPVVLALIGLYFKG